MTRHRIYLSPPHVGADERAAILEAFDSNWIAPLGPQVEAFEHEFAARVEMPYAVALSSGTAALHLALITLGIGRGWTVLTSTLTFAATANAIAYVGAEPCFVDVTAATWTMDPDLLEDALRTATAAGRRVAVLAVDLYGHCAEYERITAMCDRFGVPLIEDAAEALGATAHGRPAGSFGRCAAFSFNGNKIITTSGGGMLVSADRAVADRVRHLATQAREPAPHYEHKDIGYNYRLSNLLAALGRAQLRGLDAKIARRRAIGAEYRRALAGVPGMTFMPEAPWAHSNGWLTCILVDPSSAGVTREDLRLALDAENIEARPVWKPMHLQPVFRGAAAAGGAVAERLFERGLCLPSGSNLTGDDQTRVIATMMGVVAQAG